MTDTFVIDRQGRPTLPKDPDATLDYSFDWTDWLAEISDTIASYDVAVTGGTLVSSSRASGVVTAWVSGGTVGEYATVRCRVTTTGGRIDDRTIYLHIAQR